MSRRATAIVLVLLFAAHPLAGIVCEIDCDQPRKPVSCHESTPSTDGPGIRSSEHACDLHHAAGTPAVVAGSATRDAFNAHVAVEVPVRVCASRARLTSTSRHGPPGADGRSLSARTAVLRI